MEDSALRKIRKFGFLWKHITPFFFVYITLIIIQLATTN